MTSYADNSRFPGPDPYGPLPDVPTFDLVSPDIADGGEISAEFRAPRNISPRLEWANLPEGTKSLAVTCYDPDAPTGSGFWHWAAYDIPATHSFLPTGAGSTPDLGIQGVVSLRNDSGQRTYYGPNPPAGHGPHRYLYAVHAIDVECLAETIGTEASPAVLGFHLHFHTLGRALVWGWYETT